IAATVAGCRAATDVDGSEDVVVADDRWVLHHLIRNQRAQRYGNTLLVFDIKLIDVFDPHSESSIGLGYHPEVPAEARKVIYIAATQVAGYRAVDAAERYAHFLGLVPVYRHLVIRGFRIE